MKKRGLSLAIIALLIVQMLTGCSIGKAPSSGESGKANGTELQIGIVARGYGEDFAKELASAFQEKTGIVTKLVKSGVNNQWVTAALSSGAKNNDIDVIFDIRENFMRDVAIDNFLEGYERAFVDLSDIYNEVPEGYGTEKTLKEMIDYTSLRSATWDLEGEGYGDGKQYAIPYVTGMEGLLYNVDLFEKYNLDEPKTTNEFFALMDQMKKLGNGTYPKNDDGREIYPYVYSGTVNYMVYMARVWWAQYDGADAYNKAAYEGKDANGNYTVNSLKATGKLSALQISSKLLAQGNGYSDPANYNTSFTNAQVKFLDGQAFMTSTGDWVEREMSGNFENNTTKFAYMRIPVNSDIIQKCDSVTSEERLVETISYIDGEIAERPSYLSDADLTRITEARSLYSGEGNQHVAYIPAYSNMTEEAKDFLRFMVSKEGQEIMLKYSYGNMMPLDVDVTKFDAYEGLSSLQKSKYELIVSDIGLNFIGVNISHPMAYAGGLRDFYSSPMMETSFGVVETSSSYKTPKEYWEADYSRLAKDWDSKLTQSGIKK